jgi:hypothetical protein
MSLLFAIAAESDEYTVTRYAAGTRLKGIETPGSGSTFTAVMSVQPLRPREARMVPEGIRQRALKVCYGEDELKPTDPAASTVGDTFPYRGRTYEVIESAPWEEHGGFFRSIAAKVEA